MTSNAHKKLGAAVDAHDLLLKAERVRLAAALDDTMGMLALLRISCGLPPGAYTMAKHGKKTTKAATSTADATRDAKRETALALIKSKGYTHRSDTYCAKKGLVHITGPGFDEIFEDLADFDGTNRNALTD